MCQQCANVDARPLHPSARATSMFYAFSTRRICATAAAAAHTFVMRVRRGRATRGGNEQSSSSGQHGRRQHAQKQHTQQQQPPGLLRHRGHACSREASRDAERARRRAQAPRSRCSFELVLQWASSLLCTPLRPRGGRRCALGTPPCWHAPTSSVRPH